MVSLQSNARCWGEQELLNACGGGVITISEHKHPCDGENSARYSKLRANTITNSNRQANCTGHKRIVKQCELRFEALWDAAMLFMTFGRKETKVAVANLSVVWHYPIIAEFACSKKRASQKWFSLARPPRAGDVATSCYQTMGAENAAES